MADEETFEKADSGASLTYPTQAGDLKKNDHVLIKGKPCKVETLSLDPKLITSP